MRRFLCTSCKVWLRLVPLGHLNCCSVRPVYARNFNRPSSVCVGSKINRLATNELSLKLKKTQDTGCTSEGRSGSRRARGRPGSSRRPPPPTQSHFPRNSEHAAPCTCPLRSSMLRTEGAPCGGRRDRSLCGQHYQELGNSQKPERHREGASLHPSTKKINA